MASSKKVRGLLVEIGGDTTKLQNALKDVDKTTSSLNKELRGINTLLKFDPSNIVLLNQKTEVLSENLEETKKRLQALVQAQKQLDAKGIDKHTSEYRNLEREIESTKQKITLLKNETSNFLKVGQGMNKVGNVISNIGNKIDNVGNKITTGLTLPIVSLGAYSVKSAMDFESAFAGVRKTVDATEEEYSEFRQGIIEMSKELPASADEISAVAEAAGQLGIQNNALLSFTRTMIDLGESTNLSSNEAATALARFANITQMSQQNFDKLGSTVVALGNNFATTESEIVEMGLRLAGAGKQVGMSESQILGFAAALSSVGIEAEAGGSAFSKVMLTIESAIATNAEELETWAKTTGMTISEFKQNWETDAAGVLSKFILGLKGLESKGENAIVVLENLGLQEIRVRDSLLRASNASGVFTNALSLSNAAWQENNALTKEATERYKTSESQMSMAKNKARALAIELGDELLPHINDLFDFLGDLVKGFSKMSDEEQKSLLQTAALVAGLGPAIKIFGNLTKVVGKTTKGFGTFIEATVLAKNGIGDATGTAATMAKVMRAAVTPVGLLTIAAGSLAAAYVVLSAKQTDEEKRIDALNKKIAEETKLRKEALNERQNQLEVSLNEIDRVETLITELGKLVETNGQVKSGYEERVKFILNEVNQAFGTEYQLVDGMVQKYDELSNSIDLVIAKTRAQNILGSQSQAYKEAQENIEDYTDSLLKAEKAQQKAEENYKTAQTNYDQYAWASTSDKIRFGQALKDAKKELDQANRSLKDAQTNYDNAMSSITSYETNSLRMQTNNIDELNKIIATNTRLFDENGKIKEKEFKTELASQIRQTETIKKEYEKRIKNADDYEKQVLASNRQLYQQQLNDTINSLVQQTSVTEKNSQAVINTWKSLAKNSIGQYQATLLSLPEATKNAVVNMTGVAYDSTIAVASAWANMASLSESEFKNKISALSPDMQEQILNLASIINKNGGNVTKEAKTLADKIINELNKQGVAEIAGINITKGFASGIISEKTVEEAVKAAETLANRTLKSLADALGERSPSKKAKVHGINYTRGYTLGILSEEKNAVKAAEMLGEKTLNALNDTGTFSGKNIDTVINKKITDATRTVFTTPNIQFNVQTLSKENLDLAFNYINKKFGSQY